MKIATIANHGNHPGRIDFSVVTIHDEKDVSDMRKFESKKFSNEVEFADALFDYARTHGAQQVHTIRALLPIEEATCECGECIGRLSLFETT